MVVLGSDFELRGVDDGAVLDDVARLVGEGVESASVVDQAVNTSLAGDIAAAGLSEESVAAGLIEGASDGEVGGVSGRVCAAKTKSNTTAEVGLRKGTLELANSLGRTEESTN